MISVVHCKKHDYDIYIGRGKCPKTGKFSKWKNPFPISSTKTREDVVNDYRNWIVTQPKLMNSLYELYDKRIACWCKQNPDDHIACHGDVLKELVEKHVQVYPEIGIAQDLFCEICCEPIDVIKSGGTICCKNGHELEKT